MAGPRDEFIDEKYCIQYPRRSPDNSAINMQIGLQTALQDTSTASVSHLWRMADRLGFGWVSGWDHFGGVGGGHNNLDGVVMHTLAAVETSRARVGSLTYCVDYRPLAVIAKTIATIDQLSAGRATLGLGAGYLEAEYHRWGYEFDPPSIRLKRLEEMVAALRLLFSGHPTDFVGSHFTLRSAVCDPTPIQSHLPIWIGGGGEQRTIPLAARIADGWNVPMIDPVAFARKCRLLDKELESNRRARTDIERSVNVGLCWDENSIDDVYGARADVLRPAILTGSNDRVLSVLEQYRSAGADWVMISMRAPFDFDAIERFAQEVLPLVGPS